jgi:hypothetical protein
MANVSMPLRNVMVLLTAAIFQMKAIVVVIRKRADPDHF